jgi:8-oxo-dGTP pyrophosphatase MutT (NUDIX family)
MHRFSAVAVFDAFGRLLVQERGDDALHDPGRWGYPGGDLEDGEDFVTAAVRELEEETGLVVDPVDLQSLGQHRFRSESCGEDDEFELFAVRTTATDDDLVCGEGRQVRFLGRDALAVLHHHQALQLTLSDAYTWSAQQVRGDFVCLTLVDHRGWFLMQERDEHAPVWPDTWCFPGGGLERAESPRQGAARELAEETGIEVSPDELHDLGEFEVESPHGRFRYHAFAAPTDLADRDVDCREGRQIVFVDPAAIRDLPLVESTERVLASLEAWASEHTPVPAPGGRRFSGVVLVDPRGRILLQERDEHAPIDPEKWGLSGGHVEAGEDFETAAYRELEEETGVRLPPGTLTLFDEFVVDHRGAHGTWDVMQVFVAPTDLADADIDCQEGRRIVFVEPHVARGLDLTSAATDIVPHFLSSGAYTTMVARDPA